MCLVLPPQMLSAYFFFTESHSYQQDLHSEKASSSSFLENTPSLLTLAFVQTPRGAFQKDQIKCKCDVYLRVSVRGCWDSLKFCYVHSSAEHQLAFDIQMVKPHFGWFTLFLLWNYIFMKPAPFLFFWGSFFGGALHLHSHAFAVWICKLPQVRVPSETVLSHAERIMYSQVASHYVWFPCEWHCPRSF